MKGVRVQGHSSIINKYIIEWPSLKPMYQVFFAFLSVTYHIPSCHTHCKCSLSTQSFACTVSLLRMSRFAPSSCGHPTFPAHFSARLIVNSSFRPNRFPTSSLCLNHCSLPLREALLIFLIPYSILCTICNSVSHRGSKWCRGCVCGSPGGWRRSRATIGGE